MDNYSDWERETILSFNEAERKVNLLTYNVRWQRHCEGVLGLSPLLVNERGGREYEFDKGFLRLPRRARQLSEELKVKMRGRLAMARGSRKAVKG